MSRESAIEVATQALGGTDFAQRISEYLVDVVAPHLAVEVHHHDIERHAEHFNEGYEAAMAQQLADDPGAAEEWLAAQKAKVLREAALSMEAFPSEVSRHLRLRADHIERGEMP